LKGAEHRRKLGGMVNLGRRDKGFAPFGTPPIQIPLFKGGSAASGTSPLINLSYPFGKDSIIHEK
jgi:hypothetical protein